MSFVPFKDFAKGRMSDNGVQKLTYKAHSNKEYKEVGLALVDAVSPNARNDAPTTLMLGPCIALVNIYVLQVDGDPRSNSFTITFREAPKTPGV
jgi:hypothetical protein